MAFRASIAPLFLLLTLLIAQGCSGTKESSAEKEVKEKEQKKKQEEKLQRTEERIEKTDLQKRVDEKIQKDSLKSQDQKDQLFARHERTPCFGTCPQYELRIMKNGSATLKVEGFLDLEPGDYKGEVPKKSLERLRAKAKEIGFFKLDEKYDDPNVTDLPSRISYLAVKGQEHEVHNRYNGPKRLKELETIFQEIVENAEWQKRKSPSRD